MPKISDLVVPITDTEYRFLQHVRNGSYSAHLDNPNMTMHLLERGFIQFQLAMGEQSDFMDGRVTGLSHKGDDCLKSYEMYVLGGVP